ncbi:MAG: hypothetical protein RLZZ290_237 [Pseudomonadota bacterium]
MLSKRPIKVRLKPLPIPPRARVRLSAGGNIAVPSHPLQIRARLRERQCKPQTLLLLDRKVGSVIDPLELDPD